DDCVHSLCSLLLRRRPPSSTLFPYTTLSRSGSSSIGMAGEREIQATVELALERGVNFFDLASADAAPFPVYGKAIAGVRDKVYRSEEHTSELQSRFDLVCRLLLEKKKNDLR